MKPQLTMVLGDYPHTESILSGELRSSRLDLVLPRFSPVRRAFASMAQHQKFDVCEMALATYLQARNAGEPITLLPVTMLARFQHANLVHRIQRPIADASDLSGRRVALQSYAQTTGMWMRGILSRQYGVSAEQVSWIPLEQPHVKGFSHPSNAQLAPEGSTMESLLMDGLVDAAVVSRPLDSLVGAEPVIQDLETATQEWYRSTGVLQINHLMCVRTELVEQQPDLIAEVLNLLGRGRRTARSSVAVGPDWASDVEPLPFGCREFLPVLELSLQLCLEQGLIEPGLTVKDLIHPDMPALEPQN